MACVTTGSVPRHTVAVLGSGIAGLSAAYYINRKYGPAVRPIVFEASNRSGGWIRTVKHDNNLYEFGPRTIRPAGVPGMNCLDLIEELGLDGAINYVPYNHASARNRLIYMNGKLERVPLEWQILYKTNPLFGEPVFKTLLREIFTKPKIAEDDSLHAFVARRFGRNIADNLVDPIIRGVCAGDARNISVKFFASSLYELEQKRGSVCLANIVDAFKKKKPDDYLKALFPSDFKFDEIGQSSIASVACKQQKWSVWTLEGGLETLPLTMEKKLAEAGVEIHKNSPVQSINFNVSGGGAGGESKSQVEYLDPNTNNIKSVECSHIISTIPSFELAKILQRNPQQMAKPIAGGSRIEATTPETCKPLIDFLDKIPAVDVTVTNLKYNDRLPCIPAFGFLVPSHQLDVKGLLGVVFNTCSFPQGEGELILTAMSQGITENTVHKYIHKILGLSNPAYVNLVEQRKCIPQYTVGHYERLQQVRNFIKEQNLPITLVGASYDGVSVNDIIIRSRMASENLPYDVHRPA